MSTLEHEIIEKFRQLEPDARQRVQTLINQEMEPAAGETLPPEQAAFDFAAWMRDIEAWQEQVRREHGGVFPRVDATTLLREIRDGEDE